MRFQCRIGTGVVLAAPTVPCPSKTSSAPAIAVLPKRMRDVTAGAVVTLLAAGCAAPDPNARPWKVEPVLHVTHSSQSSQAYYALGQYHEGSMAWDQAIAAYRKAVAADPKNVEAHDALGVALAQTGRYDQAEVLLRQAVALAPDRPRLRNNLGYVLLLSGKLDEAVSVLQSVVDQDRGNAIARANLVDALARRGTLNGAERVAAVVVPAPAAAPQPEPARAMAPPAAAPQPGAADAPLEQAQAPRMPATPRLEVSNGNGITGMAARVGRWLAARGVPSDRLTNQQPYAQRYTVVQYRAGQAQAARQVASLLPADAQTDAQATPGLRTDVRVVLGRDWMRIAACLERDTCRAATTQVATTADH